MPRSQRLIDLHITNDHMADPDYSKATKKILIDIEPDRSTAHAIEESIARLEAKKLAPKKRFAHMNTRERTIVKRQLVYEPDCSRNQNPQFHTKYSEQLLRATMKKVKIYIRQLHSLDVDFKDFPRERLTMKSGVKICICFFCRVDIYDYSLHTDLVVCNEPFAGAKVLHDKSTQTGLDSLCCVENSVKHSLVITN